MQYPVVKKAAYVDVLTFTKTMKPEDKEFIL